MSIVPFFYNDPFDWHRPTNFWDDDIDFWVSRPPVYRHFPLFNRLRQRLHHAIPSGVVKDKFQVNVDVQQFAPDEITIKTSDDNTITVEGKHEERPDEHGFISRQFIRKYTLPKTHDISKLVSNLSSDGVLTITAPKTDPAIENKDEKNIPVVTTGTPKVAGSKL